VLWGSQGQALAIVEAKRGSIEPYTAKQQALAYARTLGAPFIFLTNGSLIYFWDYQDDDARSIDTFYSRHDLERLVYLRRERLPLATVPIPETYLRRGGRSGCCGWWTGTSSPSRRWRRCRTSSPSMAATGYGRGWRRRSSRSPSACCRR
jgi:hypothetical protein